MLFSILCVRAQAEGTSRGYTSTQTIATGSGTGSLDVLIGSLALSSGKPAKLALSTPIKLKEAAFHPPARQTNSKTVKDDRHVIATKEAIDNTALVVRTEISPKSVDASNRVAAPRSPRQLGASAVTGTEFVRTQRAPQ